MADGSQTKLGTALEEERARILEELHQSQERYRVFFDTAFAGIGLTDAEETFTLANTALEEMLGYGAGELVGISLVSVTSDKEFDRYRAFTQKRRQGARDFYETRMIRRDGDTRQVLISAAPLTDGEQDFIGTMAVVVDITEQRLAEQTLEASNRRYTEELEEVILQRTRELKRAQAQLVQTEKMAAMGKLAAGVAHEINNPAGVLLMKLKFLLSIAAPEGLSDRAVSTLQVAVEQTERIERIVESLLDFSRPAEGTVRWMDINDVAQSALQLIQSQPPGDGPRITWEPGSDLPAVDVDPNELQQVIVNLIDNAKDAAGRQGNVTVGTGTEGDEVTLHVADDGPGIPDDFRDRIFDPFFTTKQVGEGTGLGLAISYGIVQKFGGTIDVASVRRQGTRMTVRLPAATESSP
jgi:PAS domain S-box-containing protein